MSAVAARTDGRLRPNDRASTARVLALLILAGVALLGASLLVASLLPSSTLAGRLLGAAGEARSGANTQDLLAHFGERLRFVAVVLLALAAGLLVLRSPFEHLLSTSLKDFTLEFAWPARLTWLQVGGPMLLAICLRAAFLNQPMRYDEALTFNEFASRPLYYGLSFYPDPNNHLLNTLLVHLAFVGLGNQPWVLRLPALVGGVLLVPATYALTRLLYDNRVAVLSAMLVAVSSWLVEYSTNSRGYTLEAVCFVTVLSLSIVALRRDSPSALLLAALVAAVGAYALPTMLYGAAVAAAWLALEWRHARLARLRIGHALAGGLLLGLVVVLVYLPVMLISGPDKLAANRFVVPLDASDLVAQLPASLARTWALWNRDIPLPIAALLLGGFVAASIQEKRLRPVPLGLLAVAVCLAMVLVQRVAPFERVWLFLLPLYFAIASAGLARLVDGRVLGVVFGAAMAVATLTSGSILASPETGAFPDAEAVARALSGRLVADDAVLTTLPASLPELQYYFPRSGLPIDTLVRPPEEADHLYVVGPADAGPAVPGWARPQPIQAFAGGSALFQLERS